MTWICKKCGRIQSDSIIYSDGICDDCFEKLNKKKKKGSGFNKILSLALVLSFMLCIFSGFGVATAEESTDITFVSSFDGMYLDKYDTIAFDKNELISYGTLQTMFDSYVQADDTLTHLRVYLIGFDSSGVPHSYSTKSNNTFVSCYYDTAGKFHVTGPYIQFIDVSDYDYIAFGYNETQSFHFYKEKDKTAPEKYSYNFNYTDGNKEFTSLCSDTMYLVFCPYNSDAVDYNTLLPSLLSGTKDNDFVPVTTPTYSAKFHSFASANDNVGGVQDILNMIDWIGLGNQYPTVDFSINDAGNNHSYSLRISSNKNYVDVCMALWEDYRLKRLVETSSSAIALAFTPDIISKFVIASSNGKIDGFGISSNNSNVADAVRYLAQVNLLKSIGDLSYVTEYNLTSPYLQFNEGESPSRAYSVCLPDYVTITKGLVYRLDIVDNYTGMILDTAYFCNDTTFQKTNTGYGTKVYNYSDYDDLLGDVDGGNGYVNNDSYTQGDSLQNDNPNDIVDWDKYNQYDFSNMQNLSATLNSAMVGLGSFFQSLWIIYPNEIRVIIVSGMTLIVVLRILGR